MERLILAQAEQIFIHYRYEGYRQKEATHVARLQRFEDKRLPRDFDFNRVHGLRKEAYDKLAHFQPSTLGAASRIAGVTPGRHFFVTDHAEG